MGATDSIALTRILTQAAGFRASDLHLIIGAQPTVRLDGKLVTLDSEPIVTADFQAASLRQLLSEEQRTALETNKELVTAITLNAQLRFKLTAYYQRGNVSLTFHFIGANVKKLSDMGLPDIVQSFIHFQKGIVIIAGSFGSGKSTTLTALVNEMNTSRVASIITIEHPIEYLFVNNKSVIQQREIGRDALSYEQAIVAASKEDVDVIVVAEAESAPVIRAILDAADAGRLVFTTITAESPLAVVDTILNSVPPDESPKIRTQLANNLAGIVSQRLIPKIGGGLVLVPDVLIPTPPVRSVIRDGALVQLSNVIQTSRPAGVPAFDRVIASLYQQKTISREDALAYARDVNFVRNALQ